MSTEGRGSLSRWRSPVSCCLLIAIRLYQVFISPLLGRCCRFEPSCSRYTMSCIENLGPVRGLWLGARRVLRCHPWSAGGYDPAPVALERNGDG